MLVLEAAAADRRWNPVGGADACRATSTTCARPSMRSGSLHLPLPPTGSASTAWSGAFPICLWRTRSTVDGRPCCTAASTRRPPNSVADGRHVDAAVAAGGRQLAATAAAAARAAAVGAAAPDRHRPVRTHGAAAGQLGGPSLPRRRGQGAARRVRRPCHAAAEPPAHDRLRHDAGGFCPRRRLADRPGVDRRRSPRRWRHASASSVARSEPV